MRATRLTLAVSVLGALVALTGCSGSDSEGGPSAAPSSSDSSSSGSEEEIGPFERTCTVEVQLTGAVEATWSGKGRSSNEAGPTIYQFEDGANKVTVFAGKDDILTNANVTVDGATYTTADPESGLDVAGNGTSAVVDAATAGVDGDGPQLKATFTCGKGKGEGKG